MILSRKIDGKEIPWENDQTVLDRLVSLKPYGYIHHTENPVPTKTPYYGLKADTKDHSMALVQNVDGTGVWVRYHNHYIHILK